MKKPMLRNLSSHEYTCNHADIHMNQQFQQQKWSFNTIPDKLVSTWRHLANTLRVFQHHYTYLAYHILISQTNCMLLTCFLHFSRRRETSVQSCGRFSRTGQTFFGWGGVRDSASGERSASRTVAGKFFLFFPIFLTFFNKIFEKFWKKIFFENSYIYIFFFSKFFLKIF